MANVELVWREGGARLSAGRDALFVALSDAGVTPFWTEWHTSDPRAPNYARELSELCIFINGRRVQELKPRMIRRALAQRTPLRPLLGRLLPAFLLAILPKCPFCWAGYAALGAAVGLQARSFHSLVVVILSIAVVAGVACLWLLPSRSSAALATVGAAMLMTSRFLLKAQSFTYLGIGMLIAGFLGSLVIQPRALRRASV